MQRISVGSSSGCSLLRFQYRWITDSSKFVVSILGPANAGKSTLFNRLQCKEKNKTYRLGSASKRARGRIASRSSSNGNAIVSPIANTTRDRRQCRGRIGGTEFTLMDTAGVNGDRIQLLGTSKTNKHSLEKSMMMQTMEAAKEADLVLVMWDAKVGLTHDLVETARWLRKLGKISNVSILANKLEGTQRCDSLPQKMFESFRLSHHTNRKETLGHTKDQV
jgi:GTP-binding protein